MSEKTIRVVDHDPNLVRLTISSDGAVPTQVLLTWEELDSLKFWVDHARRSSPSLVFHEQGGTVVVQTRAGTNVAHLEVSGGRLVLVAMAASAAEPLTVQQLAALQDYMESYNERIAKWRDR